MEKIIKITGFIGVSLLLVSLFMTILGIILNIDNILYLNIFFIMVITGSISLIAFIILLLYNILFN